MITNERQYRITKHWLSRFRQAIDGFDMQKATLASCEELARAELDALKSEEEVLAGQVSEYEHLRSGHVEKLTAVSLAELPSILIRARIAKGMTQRQLAELLGLKEQQIQKYESSGYESASLHRLRDVADALQLDIVETARFRHPVGSGCPGGDVKRWGRHGYGHVGVAQRSRPRLSR